MIRKKFGEKISALANNVLRNLVSRSDAEPSGAVSRGAWNTYNGIRRRLAKRSYSPTDTIVLFFASLMRPQSVKRAISNSASSKSGGAGKRYSIIAFSDHHGNLGEQMAWGDYWLKHELIAAMRRRDGIVVAPDMNPDAVIHCFGHFQDLPPAKEHILWIHSHPEKISPRLLKMYDRVCCISKPFCAKIEAMGTPCEWVPIPSAKTLRAGNGGFCGRDAVVFVGNARMPECHRKIVDDMLEVLRRNPKINFKIWGQHYKDLPPGVWQGEYFDNADLGDLYVEAAIVLSDHHSDMAAEGFLNPRILDVAASGGFVISDKNSAIDDYFGASVSQYDGTADGLEALVLKYLGDHSARAAFSQLAQAATARFTYDAVAEKLNGKIKT